ncbi:uncharacterized protein LOC115713710 [Cannabis sativa]|uniref:uncharacterized protein LOC115713710 n=1 Tax=Cannabis sativa TaxID=3483 RepID=UPI0029CA90EE|nr:uncharacterized protein LOC115713710 [Cannabis sativa]
MIAADENSFYLGLPCIIGRKKKAILGFLKEKMHKRILSRKGKFLSKAGREVLLKTLAQVFSSYAMPIFILSLETYSELERMMYKNLWGNSKKFRGVSWMSWNRLFKHKSSGGLSFRSLHDYNLSLLNKQAWRLLLHESSLVGRIYKAMYYSHGTFLLVVLGQHPSFIWKSIFETQGLITAGARIRIDSNFSVHILNSPWYVHNSFVISSHLSRAGAKVNQLMTMDGFQWDKEIVNNLFEPRDYDLILSLPLSSSTLEDNWFWLHLHENLGFYTVKSNYHYLQAFKGK